MAHAIYAAQAGTYEEFAQEFDAGSGNATEVLFAGLTNPDAQARAHICHHLLDAGADAAAVEYKQNTLTVLLGGHDHLGAGDGELVKRLVDGGADVNFRERRGELPLRLAITIRAQSDEDRRPVYEALFGSPDLDLDLPSNVHNPVNSIGTWLRMNVDNRPGKLDVLDEFLVARDC